MDAIVLSRNTDGWHARYLGPCATEIRGLFGTDTLPTAFTSTAKAGDVAREIARRNPGKRIGVKAAEFGPATVAACLAAGYGDTVWMHDGFAAV